MSLNEHQKRHVGVTLRLLDKEIAQMERLVQSEEEGVLFWRVGDFDEGERERLRTLAAAMREVLRGLKERFDLPVEEESTRQTLMAHFSHLWGDLEEVRPKELGGYGAVDPALNETLEPDVDLLIRLVGMIRNVFR
jgi:hypothetical protein